MVYLMVGDGTERPLLEKQVAELGLEKHVVFAGRVSDQEKLTIIDWLTLL